MIEADKSSQGEKVLQAATCRSLVKRYAFADAHVARVAQEMARFQGPIIALNHAIYAERDQAKLAFLKRKRDRARDQLIAAERSFHEATALRNRVEADHAANACEAVLGPLDPDE